MDFTTQSARDILVRIADSPFDPVMWRRLMLLCLDQNDPETFKTLQVIVQGTEAMATEKTRRSEQELPQFLRKPAHEGETTEEELQRAAFIGLSRKPQSPDFLHRVGVIYLRELDLPKEAQKHFNRALFYDPTHKGASEQMSEAVDKARGKDKPAAEEKKESTNLTTAADLGVAGFPRRKPSVGAIIKQTGQLKIKTGSFDFKFQSDKLEKDGKGGKAPRGFNIEDESGPEAYAATQLLASVRTMTPDPKENISSQAAQWLKQSSECLQGGQPAEAEDACMIAEGLEPKSEPLWGMWTMIGLAYYEKRMFLDAVRVYRKAADIRPELVESWFNMATACQHADEMDEALRCYEKAREISPNQPRNLSNLGSLYFQMGRYAEAEVVLRRAVEFKPDYARAWDNLASVLGAQERLDEAMEACRQAIMAKEDYFDPWYKLGFILFQQEDYHEAGRALRRALAIQPDFPYAVAYLAMIHARINELDRAFLEGGRASKLSLPRELEAMMWNDIGLSFREAGKLEKAETSYRRAVSIHPDFWEGWFNLGVLQEERFNYVEAIDCYSRTLQMNPDYAQAREHLESITDRLNN